MAANPVRRHGHPWALSSYWRLLRPALLSASIAAGLLIVTGRLLAEESPAGLSASATSAEASIPAHPTGKVCIKDALIDRVCLAPKNCLNPRDPKYQIEILPDKTTSLPAGEYDVILIHLKGGYSCYLPWALDEQTGAPYPVNSDQCVAIPANQLLTLNSSALNVSLPFHWKVYAWRRGPHVDFRHVLFDGQGRSYTAEQCPQSQLTLYCNGRQVGVGSPRYG